MTSRVNEEPFGPYRRATSVTNREFGGIYAAGPSPALGVPGRERYPLEAMTDEYALWLPHACDEWVIAVGSRRRVIKKAHQFVASVEAAIFALESEEA